MSSNPCCVCEKTVIYDFLLVLANKVIHFMVTEHNVIAHQPLNNGSFPFVSEPAWCPYLLVPRASLALKAFLLHQPWDERYSLDIINM